MRHILGALRAALVLLVLVVGTGVILVSTWFGWQRNGIPLASWIAVYMARTVAVLFNLRVQIHDVQTMRSHRGFILPNHLSFVDVIVLLTAMPLRFLAAVEVKDRPVLGWAAAAAGTIFVDRSNLRSRGDALNGIVESYRAEPQPPIIVFPEGRLGTGKELTRFQLGVFKLAKRHQIAYLPLAIHYDRPEIAVWHGRAGETLLQAGWRLATCPGPLCVTLTPLAPVTPQHDESTAALADAAHDAIAAVLGMPSVADLHGKRAA